MDSRLRRWLPLGIAISVYVAGSSSFLLWWHTPPYLTPYKVGEIWPHRDLFAPFEFKVYKSSEERAEEMDSLVQHFSLVFQKDTNIVSKVRQKISQLNLLLPSYVTEAVKVSVEYAYRYGYVDVPLHKKVGIAILQRSRQEEEMVSLEALVDSARLWQWLRERFPPSLQDTLRDLLRTLLIPNCTYDPQASEEKLRLATQELSPYMGTIQRGELIVRRGEIITPPIEQKLSSLRTAYQALHPLKSLSVSYLGVLFLVGIITFIALRYLYLSRRFHPHDIRPILLLLTVYFIITAGTAVFLHFQKLWYEASDLPVYHLIPLAIGPIMLAIFFDDRVGFISSITLGAQVSLIMEEPVEFFFVHGLSSMLTVFRLRVMQRRSHLYYALGTLAVGYTLTFIGYHLFRLGSFRLIPWEGLPILYANVALCLVVYPLIYLIEKTFRMSSDITFLELLDTNHPLLKELAQKAPGTFQHSLAVAALAEAAAQKIGAHPLKAHVLALFHDVGKIEAPQYFVENMSAISQGGISNPHHHLTPRESAAIIRNHVEYGVHLARRYRLPREIIEGIRSHHGTTYIQFFWEKQKRECPQEASILEEEFRYPGPLPTTKEEAILMLADSLEASSRAIPNPTAEKLLEHVRHIIHQRIAEGQLDKAPLTFQQLRELEEVFYQQLLSLHHSRIRYPEPEPVLVPTQVL
ncbi:MAG: HDIG domain-containing protein [Bacteroidia bacterium]|nr:HDIG domain-containing protein [Bacteroidia bacterium]